MVRGELKGKEGVIQAIDNTRNQVIVAGLNVVCLLSLSSVILYRKNRRFLKV